MTAIADRLYGLLPQIIRLRDAEGAGTRDALRELIGVIAEQVAWLDEDLSQLYDDQFIETCAAWVAPYIGDLIGYRSLNPLDGMPSERAEIGHTIGFRRRKGTAWMLERLAADVTGWPAHVTEAFQGLSTTQYLNHVRPGNVAWVVMRRDPVLRGIGTPFDATTHTADVRRIPPRRGRWNIPNIAIDLWRVRDWPLESAMPTKAAPADPADRRYRFNPLGADTPLYSRSMPAPADAHRITRHDVPEPITRRELWDEPVAWHGPSFEIEAGGQRIPADSLVASDLSDAGAGWATHSDSLVLVDPALGRFTLPEQLTIDGVAVALTEPRVTYRSGFLLELGGGAYERSSAVPAGDPSLVPITPPATIAGALAGVAADRTLQPTGNDTFSETLQVTVPSGVRVGLQAAPGTRPTVNLAGDMEVVLAPGSELVIDGLLIAGGAVRIAPESTGGTLTLRHSTLVPGISLETDGTPSAPGQPSVVVGSGLVRVLIDHAIVGAIRTDPDAVVEVRDSIVDATDQASVAYAALDGDAAGGELSLCDVTVIGKVHARVLRLVSNSVIAARLAEGDPWTHPVDSERRQEGCIRFSYVPVGSRTPRRHQCQPSTEDEGERIRPVFVSERYADATYGQLDDRTDRAIRTGADDASEMGAYHDLYAPQREENLGIRLDEYLRFGLEAGVFHAS